MNEEQITGQITVTGTINGTITIGGGSAPVLQEITVRSNANEQQVITPPEGVDGFSKVTVRKRPLTTKTIQPSTTEQTYSAWDEDYYGYSSVTVGAMKIDLVINPSGGTAPTEISDYLFAGQENLRSVKINNALSTEGVTVGSSAFAGCTALERVEMPKVEKINSYAFRYCPVKDYYFGSNGQGSVPILSTVLPGTEDKKIHVPASLEADYKVASGWSQYADKIVGDYNA